MQLQNEMARHAPKLNNYWPYIKDILPRIKQILKTSDVHVVYFNVLDFSYMGTSYRDTAVQTIGPIVGVPFLARYGCHQPDAFYGDGIVLFRTRSEPVIEYCTFSAIIDDTTIRFAAVPKGKLFALKRYMKKQIAEVSRKSVELPILEDGIIEDVIRNSVDFLKKHKAIRAYGVKAARGIILEGDPGNGKTMLCRYIKSLCEQNNISHGTLLTNDIDRAYQNCNLEPVINQYRLTFFDDIDISYLNRYSGNSAIACCLLTALDGLEKHTNVVRIFTTNERVASLDPAFIRPGRIDKLISINKPTAVLRRRLVDKWPLEIISNIDISVLIVQTEDFSFAELEAVRSFMVTNKILGDGTWNLDKALKEFKDRKKEDVPLGFKPEKRKDNHFATINIPVDPSLY